MTVSRIMITNPRYLAQIATTFLSRSQSTALLTDHVSLNGVFVRTDSPPPVMELLRIELVLPPMSVKVVLHGTVTRVVQPSARHVAPGVEIAFFAKSGEAAQLWDTFMAYLRDKHPESRVSPVRLAYDAADQVRRAHPRVNSSFPIRLDAAGNEQVTVGNVSNGGMFIKTPDAFQVGSDLRITLEDPRTRARIPIDCIVRRRAFGADTGIGVEFREMTDAQRAVIQELMSAAAASQPVPAFCEEIPGAAPPRIMQTQSDPGLFGGPAALMPSDDSWDSIDQDSPTL